MMKVTLTWATLMLLAACGGGATGGATLADADRAPDFNARAADFEQSLQAVGLTDTDVAGAPNTLALTTPAQLPPPGSATYSGEIALFVSNAVANAPVNATAAEGLSNVENLLLGEVGITASFTNSGGSFVGSATNFSDAQGGYDGTLSFADGVIVQGSAALQAATDARFGDDTTLDNVAQNDANTNGFLSDFDGTLTNQSGIPIAFDGAAAGTLVGPGADFVGVVSGAALQGGDDTEFFGLFVTSD